MVKQGWEKRGRVRGDRRRRVVNVGRVTKVDLTQEVLFE